MGLLTDPGGGNHLKLLVAHHTKIEILSYLVGVCWLFVLVHDNFTLKTYFSENALLPGLVQHEYSSDNERFASQMYKLLTEDERESGESVRESIKKGFQDLGLEVYDHYYNFSTSRRPDKLQLGQNMYAILRASRASSLESIVISAPFRPSASKHVRTEGGIALMLSLAHQFRHKHYWAKDVIFLVTDNEHFGAKAWVEAYHGMTNPRSGALRARAGSIQAAISLEIPSSDIDYLDLRIVGINGQMPNLDLVNLVKLLIYKQNLPYVVQGNNNLLGPQPYDFAGKYLRDLDTVTRMVRASAAGKLEGTHGFFQQYNIQALTVRGMSSGGSGKGRIGYYRLGIALEGICRSLNNLLERFHQSFFFYLLTSPNRFISIGLYMPPFALLVLPAIAKALALWADGFTQTPNGESIPKTTVGTVLPWMILAHCVGLVPFIGQHFLDLEDLPAELGTVVAGSNVVTFLVPLLIGGLLSRADADCLKCLSLIELSVGLYALSMLNFPLALIIALASVPLAVWTSNRQASVVRAVHGALLVVVFPVFFLCLANVWDLLPGVYDPVVANEIARIGGKSVGKMISEYFEYGNWLDPVMFLFLLPLWLIHFTVFWSR